MGVLTALAVLVSFGTITDGDACLKKVYGVDIGAG